MIEWFRCWLNGNQGRTSQRPTRSSRAMDATRHPQINLPVGEDPVRWLRVKFISAFCMEKKNPLTLRWLSSRCILAKIRELSELKSKVHRKRWALLSASDTAHLSALDWQLTLYNCLWPLQAEFMFWRKSFYSLVLAFGPIWCGCTAQSSVWLQCVLKCRWTILTFIPEVWFRCFNVRQLQQDLL